MSVLRGDEDSASSKSRGLIRRALNIWGRTTITLLVAFGLVVGSVGVVVGLEMTTLETEQISLFSSQTADSSFNINSYDTHVKGKKKVTVTVTLVNSDSSSHAANVTIQLLNSTDDVIVERTKQTGSVSVDSSVDMRFEFKRPELAQKYEATFIIVEDTA